jgi:trehalose/maltose transport system permease protein
VRRTLTLQQRQQRLAWSFAAPTVILLLAVGLLPLLETFWYSFTDAQTDLVRTPEFIGLKNFQQLFGRKEFWQSVLNTIVFTAGSVTLEFILGMAFALIVNSRFRGRGLMRGAMLIPWALPTVVAAQMWKWMLNDQFGVINDLLVRKTGLIDNPIVWTGSEGFAMLSIILVDAWKTTPFVALLLLAGLQLIPDELYEATDVDGAGTMQQFFAVTLPLLKPAILVALIFRTLDALRVFDVVWVMTEGQFGTESMATYNYRELIQNLRLGFGSAVSVMIFIIVAIFVFIYVNVVRIEER